MRGWASSLFLALLTFAFPAPGATQVSGNAGEASPVTTTLRDPETMPRPSARAARTNLPIILDGVLDEAAWEAAEPFGDFVQSLPQAGAPATEQTEVRVLYDEEKLYIGALLLDSDPDGIIARYLNQDYETHDDDTFGITLDTFLDRRNSFMFLVFSERRVMGQGVVLERGLTLKGTKLFSF